MATRSGRFGRPKVRAENPTGACGFIGHMTIDELKECAVGDEFDATCPSCGMFHLDREEIAHLNRENVSESRQYAEMKKEAEEE
jgi:hypothetical protein